MTRSVRKTILNLLLLVLAVFGGIFASKYGFEQYYRSAYPMKYSNLIDKACAEKGLDRALVYAVVRTESGFDPKAVSAVGARGLMQLMPDAFNWVQMRRGDAATLDHDLLFDPAVNIDYGTTMLKLLQDEFSKTENVLCAYHAGWGSVKKWLANSDYAPDGTTVTRIPYQDTAAYVAKVTKTMEIYRKLYNL